MARKDTNTADNNMTSVAETVATNEDGSTAAVHVKKVPACQIDRKDSILIASFADGTSIEVNVLELPATQQDNLRMHGLEQKLRDSYSGAKGNVEIIKGSINKVLDNLRGDKWTASRASGETVSRSLEIVQAIANLKGLEASAVQGVYDNATDEQRDTWRKHPAIKAEIASIRAKAAAERAEKAKEAGDFQL